MVVTLACAREERIRKLQEKCDRKNLAIKGEETN